ncbi:cation transporter [Kocuria atrinae]|uniref:cation transporter n=1 Tax=Kocuria atrinae TaxID=592377 RepID=UPI0031E0BAAC
MGPSSQLVRSLRITVLVVALLNLAYFFVEMGVALSIGSVALFADGVDFLEDVAINLLIFIALGWTVRAQAVAGRIMAIIILIPALAAAVQLVRKAFDPQAPDPFLLAITAGGAAVVNLVCALLLARHRNHAGSMGTAAFLAARNDVLINIAIILMGGITALTMSGWPDIILGLFIVILTFTAAREVWEAAEEESLGAKALAGEDID